MHHHDHHGHTEELLRQPVSKVLRAGRVTLQPGEEVGEHIPFQREELIIGIDGEGIVIVDSVEKKLSRGVVIFVGQDVKHNVRNTGHMPLIYVYAVALF